MEELNDRIPEEKFKQLIGRLHELYENGVLRLRDWIAMYDLMLETCERDKAETMERYLAESLAEDAGSEEV